MQGGRSAATETCQIDRRGRDNNVVAAQANTHVANIGRAAEADTALCCKRRIYADAVGHLGFNGDIDLAIATRTAVVKDGTRYVQAGAGIVADSVALSEWTEIRNKVRAAEMLQR